MYSSAVFLFLKNFFYKIQNNTYLIKLISLLKNETLGVYLIHYFIIEFFIRIIEVDPKSIVYRIFGALMIFVISIVLTKVIHKIPILKFIC